MVDLASARRDGDSILALESQAARDVGVGIRRMAERLFRSVVNAWHDLVGSASDTPDTAPQRAAVGRIKQDVVDELSAVDVVAASDRLRQDIERAATLGVHIGARQAGIEPVRVDVPDDVYERVDALAGVVKARLEIGQKLATAAETLPKLTQSIAAANMAAHYAERLGTWGVMRAANMAVHAQARAAGAQVLWIAERNACLYCLAQSGQLADENGQFNPHLSFGEKRKLPVWPHPPLEAPPRHPLCRCHLVVYLGHDGPGLSLPEVLRREAQRSVVLGIALPSEPVDQRRRASQRLVDANRGAPPTVLARTRRQLVAGVFTTRTK